MALKYRRVAAKNKFKIDKYSTKFKKISFQKGLTAYQSEKCKIQVKSSGGSCEFIVLIIII